MTEQTAETTAPQTTEDTTPTEETLTPEEEVTVTAVLRTYYIQKAIVDRLAANLKDSRPTVLKHIQKEWERTKVKAFDVTVFDAEGEEHKVGTASLPKTEAKKVVTNEAELAAWLRANGHEDLTKKEVIPAREETTVYHVHPKALDALLKEKHVKVAGGQIIDPSTGETVPGTRYDKATAPETFTAGMGGTGSPGAELILELLGDGELAGTAIADLLARPKAITKK